MQVAALITAFALAAAAVSYLLTDTVQASILAFIAGMFVGVAPDYAYLAAKMGEEPEAVRAAAEASKMSDVVLKHGWDGQCRTVLQSRGGCGRFQW